MLLTSLVLVGSLAFGAADPCAQSNGNSSHCAKAQGSAAAIDLLAQHHMSGPGSDPGARERAMRDGANRGDAAMALALGSLLADPSRSAADQREGVTLLGPLAENGSVAAALKLAGYSRAIGNPTDAEYWQSRASDAASNATP